MPTTGRTTLAARHGSHHPASLTATLEALTLPVEGTGSPPLAEVIVAELVDTEVEQFAGASVDAVLEAYLASEQDGSRVRLVPGIREAVLESVRERITDEVRQRRRAQLSLVEQMRAGAWAESTQLAYGAHVQAWRTWCRAEGVPALPLDPTLVTFHLIDYAFTWDEGSGTWARDDEGRLVPRVAAVTVGLRLAALNRLASFAGLPQPGAHPVVQELHRGIRRTLGVAPLGRRAALDLDGVHRCLAAADGRTLEAARIRVALLLRARTAATAGQLARLRWVDVDVYPDRVELELGPTCRNGRPTRHVLPAHRDTRVCLVAALRDLRQVSPDPMQWVLPRRDGQPMTRQALHLVVGVVGDGAPGDQPLWGRLPAMTDRDLARLLTAPVTAGAVPLVALRDRALLLTGFWAALRRSNISALNWGDLTESPDGVAVLLRRSKTDQEGAGWTVWLPAADPGQQEPCPTRALRAYRAALAAALGRDLDPADPVFVRLTRHGAVVPGRNGRPKRITGRGVNDVVQRLAVTAGLMGERERNPGGRAPYGAHSLRAGFVTEALRDDKLSIPEVQDVTGHKDPRSVGAYWRDANAAKHNPGRKLFGVINQAS